MPVCWPGGRGSTRRAVCAAPLRPKSFPSLSYAHLIGISASAAGRAWSIRDMPPSRAHTILSSLALKMASNSKNDFRIIIVGAGPSGLLLALLLAKQGIKVTVLEKSHEFDRQPRASFYSSPAIHEMKRAGIMDDVYKKAYYATGVSWRHPDGTYICGIDDMKLPFEMRAVSLPLDQLIPLIAGHLAQCPCAEILLQHEVTGIGQDEREAWVQVQTPDGEKRLSATYVVGCDGGSSKVRRELFGSDFPGKTWDRQIVATNVRIRLASQVPLELTQRKVYYPKFHDYKWQSSNFFISAEHHAMIAQLANDGLLRITYGEDGSLSREEMLARQPEKFKAFVPGAPEPTEYKVVNFSPYR